MLGAQREFFPYHREAMALSRSGLLSLFVVYLAWGSTFLAIRVAVTGDGFNPYTLAAIRTLVAGLIMIAWAFLTRQSLKLERREFFWLAFTGVLLWVGGHTLLIWASRYLNSGFSALLFASIPFWSVLLTQRALRGIPNFWPLLLGFVGVVAILPLDRASVDSANFFNATLVLFSAFLWSLGSVLSAKGTRSIVVSSGYQLLAAGVVNALIAYFAGETWLVPDARAWVACLYLILPGCVLAYLAHRHTLRTLPLPLVMSFAYVNPVVAVILGMLVLGEQISLRMGLGMLLVLVSVFWLIQSSARRTK